MAAASYCVKADLDIVPSSHSKVVTFARTTDLRLVRDIITDPRIWPLVTDDLSGSPEEFRPTDHPAVWYVTATLNDAVVGMWTLVPHNGVCWEIHTYLIPGHGFHQGRQAAKGIVDWIWKNTPCRRLITNVPAFNRAARMLAVSAGMRKFGENPQSFLKNGVLCNQELFGISSLAGL